MTIGTRFAHSAEPFGHIMGFMKSIRPTRIIYQGDKCVQKDEINCCVFSLFWSETNTIPDRSHLLLFFLHEEFVFPSTEKKEYERDRV